MWKWCSEAQMIIILLCPKPVVHLASHLTLYRQPPRTQERECGCGTHAGLSNPLCEDGPDCTTKLGCGCADDLVLHITVGPMHKRCIISEGGMEWL